MQPNMLLSSRRAPGLRCKDDARAGRLSYWHISFDAGHLMPPVTLLLAGKSADVGRNTATRTSRAMPVKDEERHFDMEKLLLLS